MPARRKGQGFTRKKKRKSPSAASERQKKAPASAKKAASTAASKRKAKQALALTVPTRVSARLAAFAKRKMENGSIIPSIQQDQAYGFEQNYEIDPLDINGLPTLKMNSEKDDGRTAEISVEDFEDEMSVVGEDEDNEHMIFDRGTGPIKEPQDVVVDVSLKEVEDDFERHAVLLYFWRTRGLTVTRQRVKEWIYNHVGDRETIGAIRYCRDVAKGFFSVYFEQTIARNKALETKGQQRGLQVTVFPWCSATVDDQGQQCSPRMLVLPGLPDQYLPLLPAIGNLLGTYIGSIGALDPDADMDQVRLQGGGWESAYNVTPASDNTSPRIAVMIPPECKIPPHIRLQIRPGVYKQQPIYEQLSSSTKRKAVYAFTPSPSASKKLKA